MTKAELISFETPDHLTLPGLLYKPEQKTQKVVLYLHGNGDSGIFYSQGKTNVLAEEFTKAGYAYFPFNNRGAHMMKMLKRYAGTEKEESVVTGTGFELIKECVPDIDGAVAVLEGHGFTEFILMGHSTGANKILVYNHYKPKNKFSHYIPFAGGDDSGLYYASLGPKRFAALLALCQQKIEAGQGKEQVPADISSTYSYEALHDIMDPNGDYNGFPFNDAFHQLHLSQKPLFWMLKEITKPTLIIYGEYDEYCSGNPADCLKLLEREVSGKKNFSFQLIPGADHGFTGREGQLMDKVLSWLR